VIPLNKTLDVRFYIITTVLVVIDSYIRPAATLVAPTVLSEQLFVTFTSVRFAVE